MVTVMMPSGVWSVVSAVVLGILLLAKLIRSRKYKNLPPGPRGLPVIGSLHLMGKFPQRDFTKLAETYGPLMSLWLGPRLVVVATSPAAAEEIFKTQGSNFANRIATSFSDVVLPGDIVMESDSLVRLHLKKILHLQLSTSKQLQLGANVRMEEINHVMHVIPQDGVTIVPVRSHIEVTITNIMSCMILKRRFMAMASSNIQDEQEFEQVRNFRKILMGLAEYAQTINPGDFMPLFKWMDIFGLERKMRELRERMHAFMSPIISEHVVQHKRGSIFVKDMADVLLDEMEDETLQFNITNDNVSSTLWVLGYDIPGKTMVLVNVGAIARDPKIWEDPTTFKPERFLDGMTDAHMHVEGKDFKLLPFGAGRRQCPGIMLASTLVHIMVATFMQSFDWSLPNGLQPMDLNMSEGEGVSHVLAHPLIAIPKARLSIP